MGRSQLINCLPESTSLVLKEVNFCLTHKDLILLLFLNVDEYNDQDETKFKAWFSKFSYQHEIKLKIND